MPLKKLGNLEIESEALTPPAIFWTIRYFGILIMFIIILMAILGAFGPGLLSQGIRGDEILSIKYDKTAHIKNENTISVRINTLNYRKNILPVWGNNSFFNQMVIKNIYPAPLYQETNGDQVIYFFSIQPNKAIEIKFTVEPTHFGILEGQLGIISGPVINFKQFIYL